MTPQWPQPCVIPLSWSGCGLWVSWCFTLVTWFFYSTGDSADEIKLWSRLLLRWRVLGLASSEMMFTSGSRNQRWENLGCGWCDGHGTGNTDWTWPTEAGSWWHPLNSQHRDGTLFFLAIRTEFIPARRGGLDNISSRASTPDSSSWHLVCSLMRPTWTTSHVVLDPWAPKCQGERNRCGFKLINLRWCVRQQSKANTWESRIFPESADHCWSLSSKWVKSLGDRGGVRVPLSPSQLYTGCTHMMLVSLPQYTMRG